MTPERFRRVDELYHQAHAIPAGDRSRFLDQACSDDEDLRREVESLLNEPPSNGDFLAAPVMVLAGAAPPSAALPPMTGRSLCGYHLQELLGVGGMGEVYRARDTKLERDVAIKILPRAFTSNPDRLARFAREARMLAALNHPNICTIYGFDEADGVSFLILELVDGQTLAEVLHAHAPGAGLPLPEALAIARQIADALEVAHERSIVHRDLKPANIKITPHGVAKVLDFGLAKTIGGEGATPDLTHAPGAGDGEERHGAVLGTAAYMSPEQARGLPVDKRTDIWAFGCVLYEMMTGRVTFPGDTVSDSIAKLLEREPDWSALPVGTPAAIRRLLLRCLTKDPKKRLRDIGDVRVELDAIDEVLPVAGAASVPTPLATRPWTPLPWIGLAALLAVAGVWAVRGATAPESTSSRAAPWENPLADARFSPFTDWGGTEAGAEISPDGRFVAFVADRAGEFDLWVSQVGTGRFTNLTEHVPALSPPGVIHRSFGFTGNGADIWFSSGGDPAAPKLLVPLSGGPPRPFLPAGFATPSWSPDETWSVYATITRDSGDPLFVADPTGADPRKIYVHADPRFHNHNPVWSTNGEWIYFVQGPEPTHDMDIWRLKPSGTSLEQLTQQNLPMNFLAPLDTDTLLYVARDKDRSGPWLWALDVNRKVTHRIVSGLEQFTSISASRDGQRLAATVGNFTASLWQVPLGPGGTTESDAQRYPMPAARAFGPRFGGGSLFYLSARGSDDGLWRLQNGEPVEVRRGIDEPLSEPPAVSRDGQRVAVITRRQGKRALAVMSADGTNSQTLTTSIDLQGAAGQGIADWSPDGKWLVVGGADASGPALFKLPVDGGIPVRLVEGEAVNPVWSPEGDLIVYAGPMSAGQVKLAAVRPDGAAVEFPELRVRQGGYRFLPNGHELVYLPTITSPDFWLVDLRTNRRRQLTSLNSVGKLHTFDISPDGTHIVFDRMREHSDIVLIDRRR